MTILLEAIVTILVLVIAFVSLPLMAIFAVNTLFEARIPLTLESWLAVWMLLITARISLAFIGGQKKIQ